MKATTYNRIRKALKGLNTLDLGKLDSTDFDLCQEGYGRYRVIYWTWTKGYHRVEGECVTTDMEEVDNLKAAKAGDFYNRSAMRRLRNKCLDKYEIKVDYRPLDIDLTICVEGNTMCIKDTGNGCTLMDEFVIDPEHTIYANTLYYLLGFNYLAYEWEEEKENENLK